MSGYYYRKIAILQIVHWSKNIIRDMFRAFPRCTFDFYGIGIGAVYFGFLIGKAKENE